MISKAIGRLACALAVVLLAGAFVSGALADSVPQSVPRSVTAAAAGDGQHVRVTDAVIQLSAVPGRPAAGYLSLTGTGTLTAVSSPLASRIEMHRSMTAGAVTRMAPLPAVQVRGTAVFTPGGDHLMIFGLDQSLKPGAAVPLSLTFADGSRLSATARAVAPGGVTGAHGGH